MHYAHYFYDIRKEEIRLIFDPIMSLINGLRTKVGNATLTTTAQDLSGGVNELNDQIVALGPYNGLDSTSTAAALSAAMGRSLDLNKVQYLDLGVVVNSEAAWDSIQIYHKPVIVRYSSSGYWMGIAYKYDGGDYGMMLCMKYIGQVDYLSVNHGVKTTRNIIGG